MKGKKNMPIYRNEAFGNMSFSEWLQYKRDEDKRITHGALEVKDSRLYDLERIIIQECFDNSLHILKLYFIPEALEKGSVGLYGYNRIMISKPFYEDHGIDTAVIGTLFHELVHAWDDIHGLKDTDGDFHNSQFKQTAEEHGGIATYTNAQDGFNNAEPTAEMMKRIKKRL